MAGVKWQGIRDGAVRLDVYNEGLLVYVLDQAHLPALKDSGADFQSGFAEEEAKTDPLLKKLAKEGMYLAYELEQDDAVAVEVVVGPPLTKVELAVGRWHKPQRAFLRLPSGILQVHSANTLPIHEEPSDKPGEVIVPAGDYVVSIYRLDWKELRNDGIITDSDDDGNERTWEGPQEVLVFTPAAEAKPVRGVKSWLRFPQGETAIWKGKYEIREGVFYGKAMVTFWWSNFWVNIDRSAAAVLGLEPGMSFRVCVADFIFDVIYAGEAEPQEMIYMEWAKPLARDCQEFGVAYRPIHNEESSHALNVSRVVSTRSFPIHERWMPATVTVLPDRYLIPNKASGTPPS